MAKKLFVGSLPWATTDEDLKELFSQAGTVSSANIIIDKMTGRSRGFGFVEFDNDAEAESAISMFNGKEYNGRTLMVNEARPMEDRGDRPRRSFGGGGHGGGHGGGRGGYGGGHGGGGHNDNY
jgi:RNA recognition motif-containing protein